VDRHCGGKSEPLGLRYGARSIAQSVVQESRLAKFISFEDVSADLGAPLIDGDGARDYYRLGYFRCAKESTISLQRLRGQNRSAMPILFLYRQYIESALKDALHFSNAFNLEQSDQKFGHDLAALWSEAKRILVNFSDEQTLNSLDETIAEFNTADKRADAFRYAVDRQGQRHFKERGTVLLQPLIEQLDWVNLVLEEVISTIRREEQQLEQDIAEAVAKDPF
jgi:hypothetical protein